MIEKLRRAPLGVHLALVLLVLMLGVAAWAAPALVLWITILAGASCAVFRVITYFEEGR